MPPLEVVMTHKVMLNTLSDLEITTVEQLFSADVLDIVDASGLDIGVVEGVIAKVRKYLEPNKPARLRR